MENNSFTLHKIPVFVLYLLGFVIYDNPRRKWIHKSLRTFVIIVHALSFTSLCVQNVRYSIAAVDGSSTGLLMFYITLLSPLFRPLFLLLFVWKSIYRKQIQHFLDTLLMQPLHNSVKLTYTAASLLHTFLCVVTSIIPIVLNIYYIYANSSFWEPGQSNMGSLFLENFMKALAIAQSLYSVLFFAQYCSFVAFVCQQLCSMLKTTTFCSVVNKIEQEDIHKRHSFLEFVESFCEIEKQMATFNSLFSFQSACFLAICVNDLVTNLYYILFFGKCGISSVTMKICVGSSLVNFFLFVIPCCLLSSQVNT